MRGIAACLDRHGAHAAVVGCDGGNLPQRARVECAQPTVAAPGEDHATLLAHAQHRPAVRQLSHLRGTGS